MKSRGSRAVAAPQGAPRYIEIQTPPNSKTVYEIYRSYLMHEDDLVHQRTTWSMAIQGFTVAAVGWVFPPMMQALKEMDFDRGNECKDLIQFFCVLGMGVSFISALGIFAAQTAIRRLEGNWKKHGAHQSDFPRLTGGGSRLALWMGHSLPLALPIFLMVLWFLLLSYVRETAWVLGPIQGLLGHKLPLGHGLPPT